jgi:hypothetical protein
MGNKQSNVEEATAAEATAAEATSNEDKKRRSDFPDDDNKYQKVRVIAPTNLILLGLMHSNTEVNEQPDGTISVSEFTIPENLEVYKMNTAPPGGKSVVSAIEECDLGSNLQDVDKIPELQCDSDIYKAQQLILSQMDRLNKIHPNEIFAVLSELQKEIKNICISSLNDPRFKDEFKEEKETIEKAVNLHFYTRGKPLSEKRAKPFNDKNIFPHIFKDDENMKMANKTYECSEFSPDPCNHATIALNIPGLSSYNIFQAVAGKYTGHEPRLASTEDILKYIAEDKDPQVDFSNVRNVIWFDFGCANFLISPENLSNYEPKLIAKANALGFGGSKRSKKIIKKKIKKTKKYKRKTRNTRKYKRK